MSRSHAVSRLIWPGLAIVGALSRRDLSLSPLPVYVGEGSGERGRPRIRLPLSPRATWIVIALIGLALAYGLYNPIYWLLGSLPGFDLFRVPARWLALFALGIPMLAALGIDAIRARLPQNRRVYFVILIIVGGLAAAARRDARACGVRVHSDPRLYPVGAHAGGHAFFSAVRRGVSHSRRPRVVIAAIRHGRRSGRNACSSLSDSVSALCASLRLEL